MVQAATFSSMHTHKNVSKCLAARKLLKADRRTGSHAAISGFPSVCHSFHSI